MTASSVATDGRSDARPAARPMHHSPLPARPPPAPGSTSSSRRQARPRQPPPPPPHSQAPITRENERHRTCIRITLGCVLAVPTWRCQHLNQGGPRGVQNKSFLRDCGGGGLAISDPDRPRSAPEGSCECTRPSSPRAAGPPARRPIADPAGARPSHKRKHGRS